MFIALAIPSIRGLPELVAAVTGVVAVVALKDLPLGLNIVAAALLGMTAGLLVRGPAKASPSALIAATGQTHPADSADST
jgi:predicted branched-subunit amino acid permease